MKSKRPGKIDLAAPSAPLQAGLSAFGALDGLGALPAGPEAPAPVPAPAPKPGKSRGRLLLRRETKDRGGKTVVVVSGFSRPGAELETLSRDLRRRLGCGGTVTDGEIVVQGDRPADVAAFLRDLGFAVGGVTS